MDPRTKKELAAAIRRADTAVRKAQEAIAERDRIIGELHAAGASLRSIGEAAGVSHTAIRKILDRTLSNRPSDPTAGFDANA